MRNPQVRINVTDLDRLAQLSEAQLKVWLYYARRKGADGKAWGKSSSIGAWAGGMAVSTIKNARAWLVKNGWLKPNGKTKFGLPMFLPMVPAVLSEVPLEQNDRTLQSTPPVLSEVLPPYFTKYTEVTTEKESPQSSPSAPQIAADSTIEVAKQQQVSELVSEQTTSSSQHEQREEPPWYSSVLKRSLTHDEMDIGTQVYLDLIPLGKMDDADVITLVELCIEYHGGEIEPQDLIRALWTWNHNHKDGGLRWRTIQQMAKSLRSESDNSAHLQYQDHNPADCPKCKKLRKCALCGRVEDMTSSELAPSDAYMHKSCGEDWRYNRREAAAAAAGGFELNEV
jgi:hypothetical protein